MNQTTQLISSSLLRFQDFAASLHAQGVILVDQDNAIIWANRAALDLHGVDEPEQLGANVAEYATNFRLDYIERYNPPFSHGASRHVGLCEGMLHLSRSAETDAVIRCRMQVFELANAVGGQWKTALILHPESAASDAASFAHSPLSDVLSQKVSFATEDLVSGTAGIERHPPSLPIDSGWAAPSSTNTIAMVHREALVRAKVICAAAPIPLHVLDPGMRILCVSSSWLSWLGYSAGSVIGRDIGLFLDAETRARFEQQARAMLLDGDRAQTIRCRFVKRSGEAVDAMVSFAAELDPSGELATTTCASIELPKYQYDDGLTQLIKNSPAPALSWQLGNLTIRETNTAFEALMGFPRGTLVGQNVDNLGLLGSKAVRQKFEQELSRCGSLQFQDLSLRASNGEMLTCAASATLIHLSDQACGVLMLQDMTERRRDEAQLFEAIEAIMKDSTWFSRMVIEKLATLRAPPSPSGRQTEWSELTRREREVLTMISVGQSDLEIARQLGLTRSTVRNHVATLYSKIDVHTRSAAIVWARERGINLRANRGSPRSAGRGASP